MFLRRATVYPALSRLDDDLPACRRPESLIAALERAKAEVYSGLSRRCTSSAAQALALKAVNICLAKHHFRARHTAVLSRPVGLVADPSNACGLACPGCVHSARSRASQRFDWPHGMLSPERFSALLKLYGPHAIGVYLCNYGEPLLNPETPRLVRMAKSYLLNLSLSTSLSVARFDAEAYVESGLDFMALSIDGATQPVYERFRRNGDLALVLDNLNRLAGARRRLKKRTPLLSWNFLAFEHNVHEIPLAREMARRMGADFFRVSAPFDVRWDDPFIRPAAVQPLVLPLHWLSRVRKSIPAALDADAISRAFEDPWRAAAAASCLPQANPGRTCHWLYKNIVMDATGRILPCCCAPRPGETLVFGALDGNGGDPFNSHTYRLARRSFSAGASPFDPAPYRDHCDWDRATVNIGGPEIRRYFRSLDSAAFDWLSVDLLSGW